MKSWGDVTAVLLCLSVCSEARVLVRRYSNASLSCGAWSSGQHYRSLIWYKDNMGILQEKKGTISRYNYPRTGAVLLEDQGQLVLQNVTASDAGDYLCLLRANLGGTNKESRVYLCVDECPEPEKQAQVSSGDEALGRSAVSETSVYDRSTSDPDHSFTILVAALAVASVLTIAGVGVCYHKRTLGGYKIPTENA